MTFLGRKPMVLDDGACRRSPAHLTRKKVCQRSGFPVYGLPTRPPLPFPLLSCTHREKHKVHKTHTQKPRNNTTKKQHTTRTLKKHLRWHMIQGQIRHLQCPIRHLPFIHSMNRKAVVYLSACHATVTVTVTVTVRIAQSEQPLNWRQQCV